MKRYQALAITVTTIASIVSIYVAVRSSVPLQNQIIDESLTYESYANHIGLIVTWSFISGITLMLATTLFIKWGK